MTTPPPSPEAQSGSADAAAAELRGRAESAGEADAAEGASAATSPHTTEDQGAKLGESEAHATGEAAASGDATDDASAAASEPTPASGSAGAAVSDTAGANATAEPLATSNEHPAAGGASAAAGAPAGDASAATGAPAAGDATGEPTAASAQANAAEKAAAASAALARVVVRCQGLSVKRRWRPLWTPGLSCEIQGGVTGLIGPAGCGKTSLFRLLLGLDRPSAGQAEIEGLKPPRAGRKIRERVGYVAQDLALYPGHDAVQLASLHGGLHRVWHESDYFQRLSRWQVPTRDPVELLPPLYRSLVALALALAHAPSALLVDLPTALDAAGRAFFLDAVLGERRAPDGPPLPVIVASSRPHELEGHCDALLLLGPQGVRYAGAPAGLGTYVRRINVTADAPPELPEGCRYVRGAPRRDGSTCWWVHGPIAALDQIAGAALVSLEDAYLAWIASQTPLA